MLIVGDAGEVNLSGQEKNGEYMYLLLGEKKKKGQLNEQIRTRRI